MKKRKHGGPHEVYIGRMRPSVSKKSCQPASAMETTVIVSPNFAKVASVKKALEIINQSQEVFKLKFVLEDWVDESVGSKRRLDVLQVARSAKGAAAREPVIIVTGRPLKEGYFANEHRNCFLISTAVQEVTYPTRPLHLYIAYNLSNCLPLFTLPAAQRLKLQDQVVHEDEPIGCFNDYCQTIGDIWKSMFNAHVCPICKADFVGGGLKAVYMDSTVKILERIKKLARAYDKAKRPDLFICHSAKDRRFSEKLAIDIREAGYKSWFAEFEMDVGDSLNDKIASAIRRSGLFAIVLSPDSVRSPWCRRELKKALNRELYQESVFVLPVLYKKCEIPNYLEEKVWADLTGKQYKKGLAMIIERLREMELDGTETVKGRIAQALATKSPRTA